MLRERDMNKIIEDIKDIFYTEVDVEYLEVPPHIHAEISEGKFFSKLEDYLKNILNNNEIKKEMLSVNIDSLLIYQSVNYHHALSFARNRGYGWEIPTIDDFLSLSSYQKSQFGDDIFWSSTPYDEEKMYCFSFIKNSKIIMNKGFYCNLALKRTI